MSKRKKIVILSALVLLLAVTAVCNFLLTDDGNKQQAISTATYFTEYKSEHSKSLSEQILQLDSIIADAESQSSAKEDALKAKLRLTETVEKELYLESLIKAKGYGNIVVMIGQESENVTVVVEDANFDTDDAVAIYTVLSEEIKVTPENVRIIPIS